MYGTGRGVSKDAVEAVKRYRLAAEQGEATAQANLGFMYADGQGVLRDVAEAVRWYHLAAEQGNATAQLNIGLHHEVGMGVAVNFVKAHKRYSLVASRFRASEQDLRDVAVRNRERVASRLTATELAKAQSLAREWRPRGQIAQRSVQPELDSAPRSLERESTGSGFQASAEGHILTNAHVVRGCTEVRIPSVGPVHVRAREDSSVLAILQASSGSEPDDRQVPAGPSNSSGCQRRSRRLSASRSCRIWGEREHGSRQCPCRTRRRSSPDPDIRSGSVGKQMADRCWTTSGNEVGVDVSKLDALQIAQSSGDIPQNVNFAVSAGSARAFLDDSGVPYETAPSDKVMRAGRDRCGSEADHGTRRVLEVVDETDESDSYLYPRA